jgi:hypothetical protein
MAIWVLIEDLGRILSIITAFWYEPYVILQNPPGEDVVPSK